MPAEPKTTVQAAEANALGGSKTYKKNAGKGLLGGLKAQKLLQPRESSTWKSLFKARKPMEGFAALDLPKRYVDLPPSTTFVESCCANEKVSKLVYVPITTSAQSTTGLYAVDLDAPKGSHLKLLATLPIAWLYFGTKLDDNGRLFICEFGPTHGQKGGVVLVDVLKSPNTWTRIATFPDGYQPNDIAIGEDGSLYVACNHMVNATCFCNFCARLLCGVLAGNVGCALLTPPPIRPPPIVAPSRTMARSSAAR